MAIAKASIAGDSEIVAETKFNYDSKDDGASIEEKESIRKIRKLNRKIGDNLKLYYGFRCQICGKLIGEEYNAHVVEAHHIEPFSKSLNNDSKNILIVCPNHHRIIHSAQPVYDYNNLAYVYDNGYRDEILLKDHFFWK